MPSLRIGVAAALTVCSLAVAGCADERPRGVEYRGVGLVLEGGGGDATRPSSPHICFGPVRAIAPPVCGGARVVGWDWAVVEGEESLSGATWGYYEVIGTFDGTTLTLTRPARTPPRGGGGDQIGLGLANFMTPCPPPPGGWKPGDRDGVPEGIPSGIDKSLRRNPAVSAHWIDPNGGDGILNVRMVRNAVATEKALRRVYSGNLCVTSGGRSRRELNELARRLFREIPKTELFGGGVEEISGQVTLDVLIDRDGELQRRLDRIAGSGIVTVRPALRPL